MKTSTVLTLAAAAVWFSAFGLPAQETAAQRHELATNHLKRIAGEMSARCLSDIRTHRGCALGCVLRADPRQTQLNVSRSLG